MKPRRKRIRKRLTDMGYPELGEYFAEEAPKNVLIEIWEFIDIAGKGARCYDSLKRLKREFSIPKNFLRKLIATGWAALAFFDFLWAVGLALA